MTDVVLGFKAFDIHELLCHFVAREAGFYRRQGLSVGLIDTTFVADEDLPPVFFSAACGAALAAWLQGRPQKVVLVATDCPMFWLYGRGDLQALRRSRIASYPAAAPPSHYLNAALALEGLQIGVDVEVLAARDDSARIGLLAAGDVDAAVVSSALPPAVAAAYGLKPRLFFADRIRVPTTGLAIDPRLQRSQPEIVRAMVAAAGESLQLIKTRDVLVEKVLREYFHIPLHALRSTADLAAGCFSGSGQSREDICETAITLMQGQLQCNRPRQADALYDFSLLNALSPLNARL